MIYREAAPIDTTGPNVWYVNDTSTLGDSFTSAVGYDTNTGLSAAAPREMDEIEALMAGKRDF